MGNRTKNTLIRLYCEQSLLEGATVTLEDKQAHYLLNVMRIKQGDSLYLFNNSNGEWSFTVTTCHKKSLTGTINEQTRKQDAPANVGLIFVPIKSGAIEFMIEKATELGVTDFYPILSDHSSVSRINDERLRARAIEAAEQSNRVDLPQIHALQSLEKCLAGWKTNIPIFYGDESGDSPPLPEVMNKEHHSQWAVMVGPEGGFSIRELRILKEHPAATGVTIGPRILRAETASTTLLALTQSAWGDWHLAPSFRLIR